MLHRASERLAHNFAGMVSEETVERVVFESYAALARTASVSTHLASLAEKFARDRLTALAQSRGLIAKRVPEILYVCVQNSGRSQMAAAITRHLGGDRVQIVVCADRFHIHAEIAAAGQCHQHHIARMRQI